MMECLLTSEEICKYPYRTYATSLRQKNEKVETESTVIFYNVYVMAMCVYGHIYIHELIYENLSVMNVK